MIEPTDYGNDIGNYPLIWDDVEVLNMLELIEKYPDDFGVDEERQSYYSYDHVMTITTPEQSPSQVNFEKAVTNLQAFWKKQLEYGYGINGDVYPFIVGFMYLEEGSVDRCYQSYL